jgi:hypothetical protein
MLYFMQANLVIQAIATVVVLGLAAFEALARR